MDLARRFATDIVLRLCEAGYVAYFAGGCVRDQLLGIEPHDYDVATNATPHQVRDVFGPKRTLFVGVSFGVVCVHGTIEGSKQQVEVATFRSDGVYSDGRHPDDVRFTTPEEDAQRRDFTINGLFWNPLEERIIDYVNGVQDLQAKRLRAIGDPLARFGEDKLRLMRAIRFATRFDLELEGNTLAAIHGLSGTLHAVSPERIAAEMRKLLGLPRRNWGMERLHETGLLRVIFPELQEAWLESNESRVRSIETLRRSQEPDFACALAATIYATWDERLERDEYSGDVQDGKRGRLSPNSFGRTIAEQCKGRWKLSNQEAEDLRYYLESFTQLRRSEGMPWSRLQPWLADRRAPNSIAMMEVFAETLSLPFYRKKELKEAILLPKEELHPPPLVNGGDLLKMGFLPGPGFADWLQQVRDRQLDGEITDREGALLWLRNIRENANDKNFPV